MNKRLKQNINYLNLHLASKNNLHYIEIFKSSFISFHTFPTPDWTDKILRQSKLSGSYNINQVNCLRKNSLYLLFWSLISNHIITLIL